MLTKCVKQGFDHEDKIIELYRMIRKAAQNEFVEDNDVILDSFLKECFNNSIKQEEK